MSKTSVARKAERKLFSSDECAELSHLAAQWTGNKFSDTKFTFIESRLMKRLSETGMQAADYIAYLKRDIGEREHFISAITTHKTDWFREPVHIRFLTETVLTNSRHNRGPTYIWSAACSTGEEVYSICIALRAKNHSNFHVLGTDISESCLQTARSAIYPALQVDQQVPAQLKEQFFTRLMPTQNGRQSTYQIHKDLQQVIKWRRFNLIEDHLPGRLKFDYIFLRNVLIYFNDEDIRQITRNLCEYLKPGGYLITGLSENLPNEQEFKLSRVGNSIYRLKV